MFALPRGRQHQGRRITRPGVSPRHASVVIRWGVGRREARVGCIPASSQDRLRLRKLLKAHVGTPCGISS